MLTLNVIHKKIFSNLQHFVAIFIITIAFGNCIITTSGTRLPEWTGRQITDINQHPIFGNEQFEVENYPDKSQMIKYSINHFQTKIHHKEQAGFIENSGTISRKNGKTETKNEVGVAIPRKKPGFMFYVFGYFLYSNCKYYFFTKNEKVLEARFIGYEFACDDLEDVKPKF